MVYAFQKILTKFLKSNFPWITKILYFSDGCAGRYKNKKNLYNICQHREEFGLEAEWNFFATSHGKSPCDAIGGTVKRVATRASLQRPKENQILTPSQMFEFCSTTASLSTIHCFYITHQQLELDRESFKTRLVSICQYTKYYKY